MKDILEQYEIQGYVLLKKILIPHYVTRLEQFVYAQLQEQRESLLQQTGIPLDDAKGLQNYLAQKQGAGNGKKGNGNVKDIQHLIKGEFPLSVRLRKEFLSIIEERALLDILKTMLQCDDLRLHMPPMVRFKLPKSESSAVPLHQDWTYNTHVSNFLIAWVPLCPITDECGGMDILEGSHRLGEINHKKQALWEHFVDTEQITRAFPEKHIFMNPGDVLLFGPYTLHHSHHNISSQVRCNIDYRFFPATVGSGKHFFELKTKTLVSPG